MADWFETRFREPFEAGQLDPAFAARMRALVVEEWQADAGATPPEHTGTNDREGDLIVLKTEERPPAEQPRTPRRASGRWLLVATAAVVVAVVGTLLVTAGGDDDDKQIDAVTSTPTTLESAERPASLDEFGTQLEAMLEHVPGWAITNHYVNGYDYAFNGPCSGNWGGDDITGAADGGLGPAGTGHVGFPTAGQASDAAARFVENLESCTTTAWRTQAIARTGAVLASSADAVAWIQRTGDSVDVLQVATSDGPPPVSVQVEVAEWMVAYRTWRDTNS